MFIRNLSLLQMQIILATLKNVQSKLEISVRPANRIFVKDVYKKIKFAQKET